MFRILLLNFVALSVVLFMPACVSLPNVYLVDRHTVMESEASGEWPVLEQRFVDSSLSAGPVAFEKNQDEKKTKAHILLNSELAAGDQVSSSQITE
ncbi:MAG: hypothetical protein OEX07_08615 [Gammaproteobacteria bacterium]|nr:hypothetical protein [Gammaproteobacteria bacterium]